MVAARAQAIEPPGEREDLWIIQEIARRMGLPWNYAHVSEVFVEMRAGMDTIGGIHLGAPRARSAVTYPCEQVGRSGPVGCVHRNIFPPPPAAPGSCPRT